MKKGYLSALLIAVLLIGCGSDFDSAELKKEIQGIWYSEIVQSFPDGSSLGVKGTSEYFSDGSNNSIGQYTLSVPDKEYVYQITYNVILTSTWRIQKNCLIERVVDLKSFPVIFKRGANKIIISQLSAEKQQEINQSLPNIQDLIPNGMTVKTDILNIAHDRMMLSVDDGQGGKMEYIAQRVKNHFQLNQ